MKKNTLLLVLAFVLSLGFASCGDKKTDETNQTTSAKYYRQILFSETAFDGINGIHEITEEEAKTVNNYKFTFDEKNRPVLIEFGRNGVLLPYADLESSKIVFEYTDSTETRLFFDEKDSSKLVNGKVYKYVFSLDKTTGMRNGLKFYDKDGNNIENRNKIASYTWSKLPDAMVKENRFNLEGKEVIMNEFCPFFELRFSYNEKGFVSRMANYLGDTLTNCTAENCGDIGVSYFSFGIEDNGNLKSFEVHNATGKFSNLYWGWAKFVNQYDSVGNVTETVYWDQDEEFLSGKNIPVYQNKYDAHGSKIETVFMDPKKNIINHPENGVAITEFKYDEKGMPTDTIKYDSKRVKI